MESVVKECDPVVSKKNKSHTSDMLRNMMALKDEGSLCDVDLLVEGVSFSCHKVVLAVSSLYFKHLFSADMTEKNQEQIQISNVSASMLKTLLDYMYTGKITIDAENVRELIVATDYLLMQELKEKASQFLIQSLSAENAISLLIFSERFSCLEMLNAAERFICQNFTAVSQSAEYLSLGVEDVAGIIARDDLHVETEECIFDTIVEWVRHDSEQRREEFPILLGQLRLSCMSKAFLTDIVRRNEFVCENEVCLALVNAAIDSVSLSELGGVLITNPRPSTAQDVLLVIGGVTNKHKRYKSFSSSRCYCHTPDTGEWFEMSEMAQRRFGHGLTVCGQYVYAAGGHNSQRHLAHCERLDIKTGLWSEVAPMRNERSFFALTAHEGMLYAIGGRNDDAPMLNSVHRYSPMEIKWEVLSPLIEARCSPCAVSCCNSLYILGGNGESGCLNSVEKYCPDDDCWMLVSPMVFGRLGASAVAKNDKIFVMGGSNDLFLSSCEMYDPLSDTWRCIANCPKPKAFTGISSIGDRIYVVGGRGPFKCYNSIAVYNTKTEEWMSGSQTPTKLSGVQACTARLPMKLLKEVSASVVVLRSAKKRQDVPRLERLNISQD